MKIVVLISIIFSCFIKLNAGELTERGKYLFHKFNCFTCHAPKDDAASVGPSLETISIHYLGNERKLIDFLKGESPPIIDPERFNIMKPQLYKTRHLFEEDYRALAYYLTSQNKNK